MENLRSNPLSSRSRSFFPAGFASDAARNPRMAKTNVTAITIHMTMGLLKGRNCFSALPVSSIPTKPNKVCESRTTNITSARGRQIKVTGRGRPSRNRISAIRPEKANMQANRTSQKRPIKAKPPGTSRTSIPTMRTVKPSITSAMTPASLKILTQSSGRRVVVASGVFSTAAPIRYTFSMSGFPSSPDGRKISTIMRIE